MLDARFIRENEQLVRQAFENRRYDISVLEEFLALDKSWRQLTEEGNALRKQRNQVAEEIPKLPKDKKDAKIVEMRKIADRIKVIEAEVKGKENKRDELLLNIPNIPDPSVPVGPAEEGDVFVRTWGNVRKFDFKPLNHWQIGEKLDIIDFDRGAKITGTGFYVLKGDGARLERALINFMLDLHRDQGYKEIFPPAIINRKSCIGTGQLPKMQDDMYWIERDDLWLNPTAEVPVTNLYSDEILERKQLPIYHTAYLPSFRREAGKHIETKGIARVHQFNKVELVKFVLPETSQQELENLLADAEAVTQGLQLPYRIRLLSTGSVGFHSSKTYDIEAYAAGMDQWLEVSSCSDFKDFQARRAMIKFRREPHLKSEFVHTLNGSGIALPRTMVAVLENYQNADGTVTVPDVLRPYMKGTETIG
ncbi:MAG: serine--tRNA ligase [Euryarchaeota archaeon RBG_19FT_COMBO_56_21]|nr:MAG: serine--tRNA ligase [Euryarchaeota archaeon RBG_19FT_COMBO_56_21]